MSVSNEELITSSLLLKKKKTFSYLNSNLKATATDANSGLFAELAANLPILKKGFQHFNRIPTSPTEIEISEVRIGDLRFKVYTKERQLVLQFAKHLGSDPKITFTLFKLFLADPNLCTNKDWIKYVVNPNFNLISLTRKRVEFEKDIENAFTKFYFAERLSCFKILIKIFEISTTPEHPNYQDAKGLANSILIPQVNGDDILNQMLEQLESHTIKSKNNLEPHYSQQVFLEHRALLEYIVVLIDGNFTFKASHVRRYITWTLNQGSKKLVALNYIDSDTYASFVILEACETSLLLHFLQLDRAYYYCDSAPDKKSVLFEELGVFNGLLRELSEFKCTPSYAIIYRAISLLASTFYAQLDLLPQLTDEQSLLQSSLKGSDSELDFSEEIYYDFDSNVVYTHFLELLKCPVFESKSFTSLIFKKSYRLYFMAVATVQPKDFVDNSSSVVQCVDSLYRDDPALCDLYWQEDFAFNSRRRILQLLTTYFPVYHQPLLRMLGALSGPSTLSIQRVIDYLSGLSHFAQEVNFELDLLVDTFQVHEYGQLKAVVAKSEIDLISRPGPTAFKLATGSRGCLESPESLGPPSYIIWSFRYSMFEYLLCVLDSAFVSPSTHTEPGTHEQFISECLQVLNSILEDSPARLSDLVNVGNIYGEGVKSDYIFIQRITSLLSRVMKSPESLKVMAPTLLNLLTNLLPAYPEAIVSYITSHKDRFNQVGVKGTIQYIIYKEETTSRLYSTTIAYLRFVSILAQFYVTQAVLNLPRDDTLKNLESFLKTNLPITMEAIYHRYIHWQYLDNSHRASIGRLCLEILDTFFKLNPSVMETKVEDIAIILKNYFLNAENVSYYAPLLSLICAAKRLFVKYDSLDMVKPSQEIKSVLEVSLTFLNHLFRHYIHATTSSPDLSWNPFTLFEFGLEGPNACSAHVLLDLLDPGLGSEIVLKTADLLTLICLKLCEANDMSLLAIASASLNNLSANLYNMLEGGMVNQPCKRALWIFISATQSHQMGLFKALLQGSPKLTNSTFLGTASDQPLNNFRSISDLCLGMVEQWELIVKQQPWVSTAFIEFLHHLWSNKSRCPELLDDFAERINLFGFINRILQSQFCLDDPTRSVIHDATVSFCINLVLLELENRHTSVTCKSPSLSTDLNDVIQLLVDNNSLDYQFSKLNMSSSIGFNKLNQLLRDNDFSLSLLNNFSNHFWDAHYDVTFQFGPSFSYDASTLYQGLVIYDKHYESIAEWAKLRDTVEEINLDNSKIVASLDRFRSYCAALIVVFKLPHGTFWSNTKAKFDLLKKLMDQIRDLYDLELETVPVSPVVATMLASFLNELLKLVDESAWDLEPLEPFNLYLDLIDVIGNALLLDGEGDYSTPADRHAYCHFTTLWYSCIDLLLRKCNQTPELLDDDRTLTKFKKVGSRMLDLVTQDLDVFLSWSDLPFADLGETYNLISATLNVIVSLHRVVPVQPSLDLQQIERRGNYVGSLIDLIDKVLKDPQGDATKLAYITLAALHTLSDWAKDTPPQKLNQLVALLKSIQLTKVGDLLEPQFVYTWIFALELLSRIGLDRASGIKAAADLLISNWDTALSWVKHIKEVVHENSLSQISLSKAILVQASLEFIAKHLDLFPRDYADQLVDEINSILPKLVNSILVTSSTQPSLAVNASELQHSTRLCYVPCATTTPNADELSSTVLLELATTLVHFIHASQSIVDPNILLLEVTTFNISFDRVSFGTLLDWIQILHQNLHGTTNVSTYTTKGAYGNTFTNCVLDKLMQSTHFTLELIYHQAKLVFEFTEDKQLQKELQRDLHIELCKLFPNWLTFVDLIQYHQAIKFNTLLEQLTGLLEEL